MAQIICLHSLKGGTSKSTLTLNLYHYFSSLGKSIGIIDADPQGSISQAAEDRIPVMKRSEIDNWNDVPEMIQGDMVLIDTAPMRAGNETLSILEISDLLLIPVRSSIFDLQALDFTVELYGKAKQTNKALRACIVLTQGNATTVLTTQLREALEEYGLPVLATEMLYRVAYQRYLDNEKGVLASGDQKAIAEIRGIAIELQNLLNHAS